MHTSENIGNNCITDINAANRGIFWYIRGKKQQSSVLQKIQDDCNRARLLLDFSSSLFEWTSHYAWVYVWDHLGHSTTNKQKHTVITCLCTKYRCQPLSLNASPGTIRFVTGKSILLNIFQQSTLYLVLEQNYWDALKKGFSELHKEIGSYNKETTHNISVHTTASR